MLTMIYLHNKSNTCLIHNSTQRVSADSDSRQILVTYGHQKARLSPNMLFLVGSSVLQRQHYLDYFSPETLDYSLFSQVFEFLPPELNYPGQELPCIYLSGTFWSQQRVPFRLTIPTRTLLVIDMYIFEFWAIQLGILLVPGRYRVLRGYIFMMTMMGRAKYQYGILSVGIYSS